MPIKDGDKVYFKIQSGAIRTGKYDSKTKMVMLARGKKAKPPKKALFHTRAETAKNAWMGSSNPNPELGAAPRKKKVPKGSHRMPNGSIMKDKDMKGKRSTAPGKKVGVTIAMSGSAKEGSMAADDFKEKGWKDAGFFPKKGDKTGTQYYSKTLSSADETMLKAIYKEHRSEILDIFINQPRFPTRGLPGGDIYSKYGGTGQPITISKAIKQLVEKTGSKYY